MDLALSAEQEEIRRSARAFLARACPPSVVRRLSGPDGDGHDAGLWRSVCELGWPGLAFPDEWGGGGGDLVDLAVVYEEAGRALLPTPLYSTVAAALAVARGAGEEQRRRLLPPVLTGERLLSWALPGPTARTDDPPAPDVSLTRERDRAVLSGRARFVPNAGVAGSLLVAAREANTTGGPTLRLVVVPADADGVERTPLRTFAGDSQDHVLFDAVAVPAQDVLAGPAPAGEALRGATRDATALQCVEMVGGARAVLDMTVAYVAERRQFGRPIGSFQAVQHQVADMAIAVDAAGLAAWQAVWHCAVDGAVAGPPRPPGTRPADRLVAVAKAAANAAYRDVTLTAHQLHGGVGFAVEHDLHLWSNRAVATGLTLGTTEHHLGTLGRMAAAGAASTDPATVSSGTDTVAGR